MTAQLPRCDSPPTTGTITAREEPPPLCHRPKVWARNKNRQSGGSDAESLRQPSFDDPETPGNPKLSTLAWSPVLKPLAPHELPPILSPAALPVRAVDAHTPDDDAVKCPFGRKRARAAAKSPRGGLLSSIFDDDDKAEAPMLPSFSKSLLDVSSDLIACRVFSNTET